MDSLPQNLSSGKVVKKAAGSKPARGFPNKKAMGSFPYPPMALDVHLYTGLFLQPKDGLQKKEAAEDDTRL